MNLHNTWIYTRVCIKYQNIGAHGSLDLYQNMHKISKFEFLATWIYTKVCIKSQITLGIYFIMNNTWIYTKVCIKCQHLSLLHLGFIPKYA